jgi:putative SOS response-associated peptidase YedK
MCGLYSFRKSPEEARALLKYLEQAVFPPRQYVTPGGPIAIVREEKGQRHFALVRWGFIPGWVKEPQPGKPLINARSETVLEKPSFRNAIRRRRCLIPADGFYEWEGDTPGKKRPWFIEPATRNLMAFAGIWEHWMGADGSEIETAAIITTEANAEVAAIHTRSPVVIAPENFAPWLDCDHVEAKDVVPLMRPAPTGYFTLEPTVIQRKAPPPREAPPPKPVSQMKLF